MFHKDLCWALSYSVSNIRRSVHFHLRNIGSIRPLLSDTATAQIVHSLVTYRLDYCNSLLYGLPENKFDRLQRIQNIACRIVCKIPREVDVLPKLEELHWLPVRQRITFKVLLLAYKAQNSLAPLYLTELLKAYTPGKDLPSSKKMELSVPTTNLKTYGDRSFVHCSPMLWNELPHDLKNCELFDQFKSMLKTHLFKIAFPASE